jgi:hypothetical protein
MDVKQELKILPPPTPRSTHEHFSQDDGKNGKPESKTTVTPVGPHPPNARLTRLTQRPIIKAAAADPTKKYIYIYEDEKGKMLSVSENEPGKAVGAVNAIAKAVSESPAKLGKALEALNIKFTRYTIAPE